MNVRCKEPAKIRNQVPYEIHLNPAMFFSTKFIFPKIFLRADRLYL
jgi:hypothetical protein